MTGLAVEAAAPFFRDPTKTAAQVGSQYQYMYIYIYIKACVIFPRLRFFWTGGVARPRVVSSEAAQHMLQLLGSRHPDSISLPPAAAMPRLCMYRARELIRESIMSAFCQHMLMSLLLLLLLLCSTGDHRDRHSPPGACC